MNKPKVFEQIYKVSPIGIAFINLENRFMEANNSFCESLAYSEPELTGKEIDNFIHPEDFDTYEKSTKRLISGEIDYYNCYIRFISKMGRSVWFRITAYPIKLENTVSYIVLHTQQIVNGEKFKLEYKNSQELHLKESTSLLPLLIENWQWTLGTITFLLSIVIGLGIVIYSSSNRLDVLEKILLDKVKIEATHETMPK